MSQSLHVIVLSNHSLGQNLIDRSEQKVFKIAWIPDKKDNYQMPKSIEKNLTFPITWFVLCFFFLHFFFSINRYRNLFPTFCSEPWVHWMMKSLNIESVSWLAWFGCNIDRIFRNGEAPENFRFYLSFVFNFICNRNKNWAIHWQLNRLYCYTGLWSSADTRLWNREPFNGRLFVNASHSFVLWNGKSVISWPLRVVWTFYNFILSCVTVLFCLFCFNPDE